MTRPHRRRSVYFTEPIMQYLRMVGEDNYSGSISAAVERYLYLVSDFPVFTRNEWLLICDALKSTLRDRYFYKHGKYAIAHEIEDACILDGYDEKWDVSKENILEKIDHLTESEAVSVLHVVDVFWKHSELEHDEALAKSGLRFPKQNA